ncbi:hypothetical protein NQ315_014088 [Exocentrus adspersus]|uniref:Uncharacterized protein n=1 Tax=Exocentrus adspersus TaxID=1586481 RepID=A0AAV8VVH0_9CUCU|nr:hypothetical protein NQ315_014088 [Exocentrus adspersus]
MTRLIVSVVINFLEGGRMHMKRHQTLNLHTKNVKKLKGAVSIEKCLISEEKKKELLQKKEAQLKMAIHLAEHNLSFAYMEHANQFYSHLFPDSQIAANFNCSRKLEVATSEKIFSVICELFKDNQVNINNLMGFASDNASVMMGDIKGPEIVNSKIPLSRINPANPDYYLQLQNIYLGIEAEQFITSLTLDQVSINSIKVKCLDFYSKLCSEIRNRVDFSDETLNMLQILNPKTIFLEEKPSLASLVTRFPNVIKNENLLDLDLEWRQLSNVKPPTDINNIEEVINYLNKAKNGVGELLFPNLAAATLRKSERSSWERRSTKGVECGEEDEINDTNVYGKEILKGTKVLLRQDG